MLCRQEILTQEFIILFFCAHASSDFYLGDHNHVQQKNLTYFSLHSGLWSTPLSSAGIPQDLLGMRSILFFQMVMQSFFFVDYWWAIDSITERGANKFIIFWLNCNNSFLRRKIELPCRDTSPFHSLWIFFREDMHLGEHQTEGF